MAGTILWLISIAKLWSLVSPVEDSFVVELTDANLDAVLANHDAVIINFYANWCPYSQLLKPQFAEAGKMMRDKFGATDPKAVAAAIDSVALANLAERFQINKYPTVKLSLHGKILDNEYRGKREGAAILKYVEDNLRDMTITLNTTNDFDLISSDQPTTIAYVTRWNNDAHQLIKKIASWMQQTCQFYVTNVGGRLPVGTDLDKDHVFLKDEDNDVLHSTKFAGDISDSDELYKWLKGQCQTATQELTFQNAEELAEPAIPFLVLYRHKDDAASLRSFKAAVKRELTEFLPTRIRPLTADGNIFVHPLHQAGKSQADLPIILLDSFIHTYVFKNIDDVNTPGKLRQFILDLESEKLHRDYHDDEDERVVPDVDNDDIVDDEGDDFWDEETNDNEPSRETDTEGTSQTVLDKIGSTTTLPESSFKYLQPSRHRYTFKRDEL